MRMTARDKPGGGREPIHLRKPLPVKQAMLAPLASACWVFLILAAWWALAGDGFYVGLALTVGGFLVMVATMARTVIGLIRRVESRDRNIAAMDQQLLKMSRLAASSAVGHDHLVHLKDVLVNIDTIAAWGRHQLDGQQAAGRRGVGQQAADPSGTGRRETERDAAVSFDQIRSEAAAAHDAIDRFLRLMRPPGDRHVVQPVDVNALIAETAQLLTAVGDSRRIPVRLSLTAQPAEVRSDPARLNQMFQSVLLAIMQDAEPDKGLAVATSNGEQGIYVTLTFHGRRLGADVFRRLADPGDDLRAQDIGLWLSLAGWHADRLRVGREAERTTEGLNIKMALPYRMMTRNPYPS